jgi:epoxyqueuosine reductase QueG
VSIDSILSEFVEERQISIFGITSADGYEHALPGWSPKEMMPRCKSVIIFGRPFVGEQPYVVEEKHLVNESWWEANDVVSHEIAQWRGELINLLDEFGIGTANFGGYGTTTEPTFSYRLAQYEAGIGVYGRFGVCLNPDFGCYYKVSVLLTEAGLIPTDNTKLGDFSPCESCKKCAEVCPVYAIDPVKDPAEGYNRDLCSKFILTMKRKHGEAAKICARCFSVCPWGWEMLANKSLTQEET